MNDNGNAARQPTRFGAFEVERAVGKGSFGRTYLVYGRDDHKKETPYALKWLLEGAEGGADARFDNEVWALENLDHPVFPKFIQKGKMRGRPYIVMTFAEGQTVGARIQDNALVRTFFSGLNVSLIAQQLLEALNYLNNKNLIHRDIKDDNVIVSTSGNVVTLIDLGLCKGMVLPAQNQTFFNAGAARFAPPTKLENPSSSVLSHDVFAVGVLCYRMLTNAYPWEVGPDKGVGDLRKKMLEDQPVAIQELNNAVDDRICALVMSMLNVRDSERIQLEPARSEVARLRESLEHAALPNISRGPPLRLSRVVRDPVHGDIQMTDLEFAVLNCREMQRLRRIRQLGTTHLVYPGAEHSRLAHAIGVVHIVERILRAIEMREGFSFSAEERWTARLSALVHDVAHAPFGHTLEDELGFFPRHDKNVARLNRIFNMSGAELPAILQASEIGRTTFDLLFGGAGSSSARWIESLLSGSVGADVLDYVDRDSFHCGLDSRIDSAIYRRFTLDRRGARVQDGKEIVPRLYGSHGFRLDADYAVLSVLETRFSMFLKVYSHPVKTAAGAMIGKALSLAVEHASATFCESAIECLGDEQLISLIEERGSEDSRHLMTLYRERKLFRPSFRARIMQDADLTPHNYRERQAKLNKEGLFDPRRRLEIEADLARQSGLEARDVIIYASPKAPGARTVSQKVEQSRGEVAVRDGVFSRHQEVFSRHLALWNLYLFSPHKLPAEHRERLSRLMRQRFDLVDELTENQRQLALNL